MNAIQDAVKLFGGKTKLARRLGISQQAVHQWTVGKRPVPPRHALTIEKASHGKFSCHDLRPDIFGPPPKEHAA